MPFQLLIEILMVAFIVTQLVIPAWRGVPMFPLFRRSRTLMNEIDQEYQNLADAETERRIEKLKARQRKGNEGNE